MNDLMIIGGGPDAPAAATRAIGKHLDFTFVMDHSGRWPPNRKRSLGNPTMNVRRARKQRSRCSSACRRRATLLYDRLPKKLIFLRELILLGLWRLFKHWEPAHEWSRKRVA